MTMTLVLISCYFIDHLYGLDSSFDQIIYCTSLTKQLLLLHIPSLDPDILVSQHNISYACVIKSTLNLSISVS